MSKALYIQVYISICVGLLVKKSKNVKSCCKVEAPKAKLAGINLSYQMIYYFIISSSTFDVLEDGSVVLYRSFIAP